MSATYSEQNKEQSYGTLRFRNEGLEKDVKHYKELYEDSVNRTEDYIKENDTLNKRYKDIYHENCQLEQRLKDMGVEMEKRIGMYKAAIGTYSTGEPIEIEEMLIKLNGKTLWGVINLYSKKVLKLEQYVKAKSTKDTTGTKPQKAAAKNQNESTELSREQKIQSVLDKHRNSSNSSNSERPKRKKAVSQGIRKRKNHTEKVVKKSPQTVKSPKRRPLVSPKKRKITTKPVVPSKKENIEISSPKALQSKSSNDRHKETVLGFFVNRREETKKDEEQEKMSIDSKKVELQGVSLKERDAMEARLKCLIKDIENGRKHFKETNPQVFQHLSCGAHHPYYRKAVDKDHRKQHMWHRETIGIIFNELGRDLGWDFGFKRMTKSYCPSGTIFDNFSKNMKEIATKYGSPTAQKFCEMKEDVDIGKEKGDKMSLRMKWWMYYMVPRYTRILGDPLSLFKTEKLVTIKKTPK